MSPSAAPEDARAPSSPSSCRSSPHRVFLRRSIGGNDDALPSSARGLTTVRHRTAVSNASAPRGRRANAVRRGRQPCRCMKSLANALLVSSCRPLSSAEHPPARPRSIDETVAERRVGPTTVSRSLAIDEPYGIVANVERTVETVRAMPGFPGAQIRGCVGSCESFRPGRAHRASQDE